MSQKLCRLCFEEKVRPIGIFSSRGVEQNIAEVIRAHFSDEVSENDHLPKSVCVNCWTTVKNFHELYIAVDQAKHTYLTKFVKTKVPKFIEINCDAVESDEDAPTIKDEVVDHVRTKVEMPSRGNGSEKRASAPSGPFKNDSNDFDVNENNGSHADAIATGNLSEGRRAISIKRLDVNATKVDGTSASAVNENEAIDKLISNYMDMSCELCNISFDTWTDGIGHYRKKHNKHSIFFRCCQRRLRPSDIRDHIRYHSNPDMFKCEKCGKRFIENRLLKSHQVVHLPKKFECDICKKKFLFRSGIHAHMLTSHGKEHKRYECQNCEKRFDTLVRLNHHVRIVHERQDQQVCHICAKVYNSLVSLQMHLKDHSDVIEPRAQCKICGKWYKNEQYVRRHMKTAHQTVGQILHCPKCGKPSPNRNALSKHISTVHNYTAHVCHLCDREFKQSVALKEHLATHTGEDLYTCAYCPKMFKCRSNMYKHHKQVHPNEWNADRKT